MSDNVKNPAHYTTSKSGVECIQVAEHMNFCRGNALKYLWRAGLKGDELEDLKKCRWYIDREIARLEHAANKEVDPPPTPTADDEWRQCGKHGSMRHAFNHTLYVTRSRNGWCGYARSPAGTIDVSLADGLEDETSAIIKTYERAKELFG